MKEEQFYMHSVNRNWILFDCLTCEYVYNNFIINFIQFMMFRKPNLSVHVKLAKLASIPPRWAKIAPTQPKWSWMEVGTWMKWLGEIMTPWNMWVWKIRWLRGSRVHWMLQNWTKYTSSAPSQPSFPHSMNGTAPAMMRVHIWLVDWVGVLM